MTRFGSGSPQSYMTGFDRTFGGLFDALGFGPMRKLQAAAQELAAASLEQNQARASYAMIVQGAFAAGLERLMTQLAKMADEGGRVDSVLALLKMWAVQTEAAVHEQLQSPKGLAATAAMTRGRIVASEKAAAGRRHCRRLARHGNAARARRGIPRDPRAQARAPRFALVGAVASRSPRGTW